MICPCGTSAEYETCCGRLHDGAATADTAEALMRSRYSAFAQQKTDYLKETTWPPYQKHFDQQAHETRAKESVWLGLEILNKENGSLSDTRGTVTFIARSMVASKVNEQKEKSLFKKKGGKWYYVKALD